MVDPSQASLLMKFIKPILSFFGRYARLEQRATDLENKLERRSQSECPSCGGRQYFVSNSEPRFATSEKGSDRQEVHSLLEYAHTYTCKECGYCRIIRELGYPK